MARPLRVEFPGAVYHITSRGNARGEIYHDDADRQLFLRILAATVERRGWRVFAYCLMGNHYHLLIETPQANLSAGMRQLNGTYSQRFNHRHERVGHVLQGRFHSIVVDRDNYLLELGRYIALNPVRAGLVATPEAWPWSSYRAMAGLDATPRWLAAPAFLKCFSRDPLAAQQRFRRFVADGFGAPSPWPALQGGIFLGSVAFLDRMAPYLRARREIDEIPREQRLAARPPLAELLNGASAADRATRERAIGEAYHQHAYTRSEIARYLSLHYSTVSRIAARLKPQSRA